MDDVMTEDSTKIAEMYERQVLAQSKATKKNKGGNEGDDGFW